VSSRGEDEKELLQHGEDESGGSLVCGDAAGGLRSVDAGLRGSIIGCKAAATSDADGREAPEQPPQVWLLCLAGAAPYDRCRP